MPVLRFRETAVHFRYVHFHNDSHGFSQGFDFGKLSFADLRSRVRHTTVCDEALPGVWGNRGIRSFISGEQGNKSLKLKGKREQRQFWETGNIIENEDFDFKEQRKMQIFSGNKGIGTHPGRASVKGTEKLDKTTRSWNIKVKGTNCYSQRILVSFWKHSRATDINDYVNTNMEEWIDGMTKGRTEKHRILLFTFARNNTNISCLIYVCYLWTISKCFQTRNKKIYRQIIKWDMLLRMLKCFVGFPNSFAADVHPDETVRNYLL